MNKLIQANIFKDNGNVNREKENLTYMSFIDLNQISKEFPISFFRSDFRGSSFKNCKFYRNNFDRADLVSCFFTECSFNSVNIAASEIKNCYFFNTKFQTNQYNHTSIQECTFENCSFADEKFIVNMKNCTFANCTIDDSAFDRSTTEQITFKNCKILNTDFATMHAERHRFINCNIENTSMGISYIFGYLFYMTDLENIHMLYRGERIFLTAENTLGHYAKLLYEEKRYYEFLNAHIICRNLKAVPSIINDILEDAVNYLFPIRQLEIQSIFDLLLFYTTNGVLPFNVYLEIIEILDSFQWQKFLSEERFNYLANIQKLKLVIEDGNYNFNFINNATDSYSLLTIHCNTDNLDQALDVTNHFLSEVSENLGFKHDFELVDKKRGSWILTFVVITAVALAIPKIVSEVVNVTIEVDTKLKLHDVMKCKLKKRHITTDEIREIAEIASTAGLLKGSSVRINPSEIIDSLKIHV